MKRALVVLLLFSQFAWASQYSARILFVFFDAGETLALEPVIEDLIQKKIEVKVFAMGSASHLMGGRHYVLDLKADCGVLENIDSHWSHEKGLTQKSLDQIQNCAQAPVVVTGVISEIQRQISELFRPRSKVIGYFDGLSDIGSDSLLLKFLRQPIEIWIPTQDQRDQILKLQSSARLKVVGQPSLEKWEKLQEGSANLNDKLIGFKEKHPTILYAGGYGESYAEAFKIFLGGIKNFYKTHNIIISLHPKVDGSVEKEILKENPTAEVILAPKTVSTRELARRADLVISQNSTVGIQSLFMGRPALYVDVPGSTYNDFAIRHGLISQISTPDKLEEAIRNIKAVLPRRKIYELGGIPQNSTQLIVQTLVKEITN